jgi:hypothetical protein
MKGNRAMVNVEGEGIVGWGRREEGKGGEENGNGERKLISSLLRPLSCP